MSEKLLVALLLEDEPLIAIDVELALANAGFFVVTFGRCTEAEEWLEENSAAIAVIDVALSDGVCIKAASMLVERKIPFIVHSGHDETPEHRRTVFGSGTWMSKPTAMEALAATAQKLAASPIS